MTTYYIQDNNKIIGYDTDKERLETTIKISKYKNAEILKTEDLIIDGKIITQEQYEQEQAEARKEVFYTHFIKTSLGNFRLVPQGYANAQQSIDVVNNNVNTLRSLTEELAKWIIFYETPDFTKAEECTEEWLVAHQKNPSVMTLEEWQKFYFEFCQLYAMQQYKTTA